MNLKIISVLSLSMAAAASLTFATPVVLAPGGTVTAFTPTTSSFSGTLLAAYSMGFSNGIENGTVTEEVYKSSTGTLDFYYQVKNNASSTDSLTRVTVSTFTGFSTSVDYLLNGGDAPTSATRQSAGNSVGFFLNIAPGTTTDWLEVATNATTYNSDGTIAVIDSLSTNFLNTPEPAMAVPEPLTLGVLSAGLLLIGVARLRRS